MKHLKKLLLSLPIVFIMLISLTINNFILAWNDDIDVDYYIIPKIDESSVQKIQDATDKIWKKAWNVMDYYRDEAKNLTPEEQRNSWILTRDSIMSYLKFIIKFLSQFWLLTWAGFIIFAGYKYMVSVFNWNSTDKSMITNAIIWVIIIIFSYAILKTFTSMVWLS